MWYAGTPCPIDGKIGEDARQLWISTGAPSAVVFTEPDQINEVLHEDNKASAPFPALLLGVLAAFIIIGG
jgi:hypothetical protein